MLIAAPKTALFYITNTCNLHCRHCGVSTGRNRVIKNKILPPSKIANIFKKLHEIGLEKVSLTGGEPFLRNDLLKILLYAKKSNIKIAINTNLTFLPDYFSECIAENLIQEIALSIDGANSLTHDQIRGHGNFEKTLLNIEKIHEFSEKYGYGPKLSFTSVPNLLNYEDIDGIIELAREKKVQQVQFEKIVYNGNAANNLHQLLLKEDMLLNTYSRILYHAKSAKDISITANGITNIFIEYYNLKFNANIPYTYFSCTSPHSYIYISYDGTLLPCAAMSEQYGHEKINSKIKKMLNLCEHDFAKIISTNFFSTFIKRKLDISVLKTQSPCYSCKFLGNYCMPCISNIISGKSLKFDLCESSSRALALMK